MSSLPIGICENEQTSAELQNPLGGKLLYCLLHVHVAKLGKEERLSVSKDRRPMSNDPTYLAMAAESELTPTLWP